MCSGPRLKKSSTHEPPSTIHSIRAVQTTDRGTYLCRRTTTPPSGERWLRENGTLRSHLLPSGGCCQENLHRLANGGYGRTAPIVATRCQAVDAARKISTTEPHRLANGGYGRTAPFVATRCQAVDVARKISTTDLHRLANGGYNYRRLRQFRRTTPVLLSSLSSSESQFAKYKSTGVSIRRGGGAATPAKELTSEDPSP